MAQHDFNIANDYFPPFRADINNALLAIITNSSGTSAPTTTYPYQWWADTTTMILKQRNGANTAWINILTLGATNGGLASLASPAFTGVPTSTLPAPTDNTARIATTAHVRNAISRNLVVNAFQTATQEPIAFNNWARINVDSNNALRSGDTFTNSTLTVSESGAYQIISYCEYLATGPSLPSEHLLFTSVGVNTITSETVRLSSMRTAFTFSPIGNSGTALILLTAGQQITFNYRYEPIGGSNFSARISLGRFSVTKISD